MATVAHVLYCFEVLDAALNHRSSSFSLHQVEEFYGQYLTYLHAIQARADSGLQVTSAELECGEGELDGPDEDDIIPMSSPPTSGLPTHPASSSAVPSRMSAMSPSTNGSSTPSSLSGSSASPSSDMSKSSSRTSLSSRLSTLRGSTRNQKHYSSHPMFVTWNILDRRGHKNLRGCIGTFDAQTLDTGLRSYALTSAFDDTRFLPIAPSELEHLECGVTLLTDFEPASSPMSWDIGTHGLRISFTWQGKRYGSTYLPDVAREQGWTKTEAIISLMRKAGWNGRKDEWTLVRDLQVIRYQGLRVNVGYHDWRTWRDWIDSHDQATAPLT